MLDVELVVSQTGVNLDTNSRFTEDEQPEGNYSIGFLFKYYRGEFGRCTGKVFKDTDYGTVHGGWTFLSRQSYTDCDDTYLREWWVSYSVIVTLEDETKFRVPFDVTRKFAVVTHRRVAHPMSRVVLEMDQTSRAWVLRGQVLSPEGKWLYSGNEKTMEDATERNFLTAWHEGLLE